MLPLLVVLFLISYVLLTSLLVLQDRTIDSQRSLIHLLFKDNLRLLATKAGLHRNKSTPNQNTAPRSVLSLNPSTQVQSGQTPSTQIPSPQIPATQTAATQTPSAQVPVTEAKPEASAKSGRHSRKLQKSLPARPPVEMTDPSDMRRVSISI
jgi:hypothetical protein